MNYIPKPDRARLATLALLLACAWPASAYDWLPPTNKIVLLVINAHPDDEGIFFGGSLPYYAGLLQVPTMLLSMTGGNNPAVRDDELRCSAWTDSVRYEPVFAPFPDVPPSTNNPYTNTIDMVWDIWADGKLQGDGSDVEAGKAWAANYIAEQIRRYRPEVIITHDLNGEYGHDVHKATARAVTNAFFVAADPNATATNLVGLPPWQAKKLYLHLYPTNQLFHKYWEMPFAQLTNQTARQVANLGLQCDVSQGFKTVGSVYDPNGYYFPWPSEWWGLYASTVGPDTVLSSNAVVMGYAVPSGAAAENFLEHLTTDVSSSPPVFTANPIMGLEAATTYAYTGQPLADYVFDWDLIAWNPSQVLTFTKSSGPAWLSVAVDGTLVGTPSLADAGTNTWVVRVTDDAGLFGETTLTLLVGQKLPGLPDLVGWWRLDVTTPAAAAGLAPVVPDSAPPSPDGGSFGGVIFGQAGARPWTGPAALFNGTSAKVDVPYSAALNPPVFTAALWAKVIGGSSTYRSPLSSRNNNPQAGYVFYAGLNNLWQFWMGSGSNWNVLTAGPVVNNAWIHLAATYDGATACFYTNGVLAASTPATLQPNTSFPLRIGAGATEGPGNYWFPGFIDDVQIYNAALPPARIWALYGNTPPSFTRITKLADGTTQLEGTGFASQTYILLAATNQSPAAAWMPVSSTLADTNGYLRFIDSGTAVYPQRFYRLISP